MTPLNNPMQPTTELTHRLSVSAQAEYSVGAQVTLVTTTAEGHTVDLPSGVVVDMAIDTRGLRCPMPILRAKKALGTLQSGQVLQVVASDPGSMRDFEAFCRQTGNTLILQQALPDGLFVHVMTRR